MPSVVYSDSSEDEEDVSEDGYPSDEIGGKGNLKGFIVYDDDELADIDDLTKEVSARDTKARKQTKPAKPWSTGVATKKWQVVKGARGADRKLHSVVSLP
ncbi:Ribonuclease H-like protein [Metarhizium robertsii ARSEF 23]|uniref:Ribonuclease H-like protein n=1 Tax=Metarhizium robertsii (strain ARSEF 23 / ATCC MYA-3075) TaxID=655844 RepID=A0A0B2X933_METRA|nr:Ribonuclease H-like protein [Metarhizium robertsii ARSEF 23]KHO11403.1 Ribonuclease H-like protein [Metarhizium robertsii ARSEF 23]